MKKAKFDQWDCLLEENPALTNDELNEKVGVNPTFFGAPSVPMDDRPIVIHDTPAPFYPPNILDEWQWMYLNKHLYYQMQQLIVNVAFTEGSSDTAILNKLQAELLLRRIEECYYHK